MIDHVGEVDTLPSIGEKSRFLRNLDPEVNNMIYLPEDPQSDFEFIAVRSHGGCVISKVVLTGTTGGTICPTCYSLPVPGGTVCLSV